MKDFKNQKGFMIVELLVAISVMSVFLLTIISLLVFSLQSSTRNKYVIQSISLAQEQLEGMKNIKQNEWPASFVGGTYYAQISSTTNQWVLESGSKIVNIDGKEFIVALELEYARRIQQENGHAIGQLIKTGGFVDEDSILVIANVSYTDKQQNARTDKFETLLTRWEQEFDRQSTSAEFQTGTFDQTELMISGGTAVELVYGSASGMVSLYHFDEESNTQAVDSSGNNHAAYLENNPTWTTGKFLNALDFDGNSYLNIPDAFDLNMTSEISLEAWVKWNIEPSTGNSQAQIINKNGDLQYQLQHSINNNNFEFAVQTNIERQVVSSNVSPVSDEWYYVVGTYDGANIKIYIDGQLENQVGLTGNIATSTSPVNIARRAVNNDRYFVGIIDEVSIHDNALSATEILAHFEDCAEDSLGAQFKEEAGQVVIEAENYYEKIERGIGQSAAYYKLDGSDDVVIDSSYDNNGILANEPLRVGGLFDGAVQFDGANDYVDIDNSIINSYPFTLSAWIKSQVTDQDQVIFNIANSNSTKIYYGIYIGEDEGGAVGIRARNTSPRNNFGTTVVTDNEWHHVVGVFASSNERHLYVDGNLEASGTANSAFDSNVNVAAIGRWADKSPKSYFNGSIDEVQIYSDILDDVEVSNLYDSYINNNMSVSEHIWQDNNVQSGFEGDAYIESRPNDNTLIDSHVIEYSPELKYNVSFDTVGTYYVWIRGLAKNEGSKACADNDSVYLGLNSGVVEEIIAIEGFCSPESSWQWQNMTVDGVPATIEITSANLHMINVWMMEDGFMFDRILLTTDSNFVPNGTGPIESDRYSDLSCTPIYNDLGGYASVGTYTSKVFDTESVDVVYNTLKSTMENPMHTNIRFHFATKDSNSNWIDDDFLGPDTSNDTYYSSSELINRLITTNKRYFCYRAYLTTSAANRTPSLKEEEVSYTP